MTDHLVPALARFVRSIAVLAMPAESQTQWLDSLGLPGGARIADELALGFDDGFGAAAAVRGTRVGRGAGRREAA
ncbi:hypothetical protein LFM09_40105 [Lentzea alba]|uniref:hypothetical protein n=1 Tax=Lentzea alba TaxID=2714351 RepID=UPI0039BFAAC5